LVIEAKNISLQIHKQTILENISLTVNTGELLMILGMNGAGKSSLVKTLLGIYKPASGTVNLNTDNFGYVPQRGVNISGITVLELLEYFAALKRCDRKEAQRVLEFIGLYDYQNHYVRQLSGGYRRKLTLAQALLGQPKLLILDEPFAGLDQNAIESLIQIFNQFFDEGGTVILTTHVFHQPLPVKTQVAVLEKGRLAALDDFEKICSTIRMRILRNPGPPISGLFAGKLNNYHVTEQGKYVELICLKEDRLTVLNELARHNLLLDWTEEHLWQSYLDTNHPGTNQPDTNQLGTNQEQLLAK
jgi:ABC-type multidrug transport system ATPase subunit